MYLEDKVKFIKNTPNDTSIRDTLYYDTSRSSHLILVEMML